MAAAVSIAGLLGWLAYRAPTPASADREVAVAPAPDQATLSMQERSAGSEVPCDVPLRWRVARVDPEFGMTPAEATSVVREATGLWEDGTGRDLFEHEPDDGFPIRLVYDDRQGRAAARAARRRELIDLRAEIEARREVVGARTAAFQDLMSDYIARADDLDRRVTEHNAAIREWNESDDQSQERWRALEARSAALRGEQEALEAERPALDREQAGLRADEEALNVLILEHEQMADELEAALPPEEVEAGVYREAVSRQGAEVVAVSREIRLYRFTQASELRLLAAHELGHALGLGHLDEPSAVMTARAQADEPVTALSTSDLELFERVCPGEPHER